MKENRTHWKLLTDAEYFGAYAILSAGKDIVLTISSVSEEIVVGADGKKEKCIVVKFTEEYKPMILNKTNISVIEKNLRYGPFIEDWIGKKIQVYATKVKAFGSIVDTFRIRPSIPVSEKMLCIQCGIEIKATKAKNGSILTAGKVSEKLGGLCINCWKSSGGKNET